MRSRAVARATFKLVFFSLFCRLVVARSEEHRCAKMRNVTNQPSGDDAEDSEGPQTTKRARTMAPALAARLALEREKAITSAAQPPSRRDSFGLGVVGFVFENNYARPRSKEGKLLGLSDAGLVRARKENTPKADAQQLLKSALLEGRLSLDFVLSSPSLQPLLLAHANHLACGEAVLFLLRVRLFSEAASQCSTSELQSRATDIWLKFLSSKAARQVMVPASVSAAIASAINSTSVSGETFREAAAAVQHAMRVAVWPSFVKEMEL